MNYEVKYQRTTEGFLFDMSRENKLYIYKNMKLIEEIQYDYEVSENVFNEMIKEYLAEQE